MIRIIDMGTAMGERTFAAFDTVTDSFVADDLGFEAWTHPDAILMKDETLRKRIMDLASSFYKRDHGGIVNAMREIAKDLNWAIAIHGSLQRDIDLIAVPWNKDASPWQSVYDAWLAKLPVKDTEGAYRFRYPQRGYFRKSMLILQADSARVDDNNPKGSWNPPCLDVSFYAIPWTAPEKRNLPAKVLESIIKNVDGYLVYWPPKHGGYLEPQQMRDIADHIVEANAAWDFQVQTDPALKGKP